MKILWKKNNNLFHINQITSSKCSTNHLSTPANKLSTIHYWARSKSSRNSYTTSSDRKAKCGNSTTWGNNMLLESCSETTYPQHMTEPSENIYDQQLIVIDWSLHFYVFFTSLIWFLLSSLFSFCNQKWKINQNIKKKNPKT